MEAAPASSCTVVGCSRGVLTRDTPLSPTNKRRDTHQDHWPSGQPCYPPLQMSRISQHT
jgi:hypothetical protein